MRLKMIAEHARTGRSVWLQWVAANVVGLLVGLGLFGFFADGLGGEHGTVRSPARRTEGTDLGITLSPTLTFIAVVVLSTALFGVMAGPFISPSPASPFEAIPFLVRFFGVLALSGASTGLVRWLARRREVSQADWGVLANSVTYPVAFVIGIAALGPPGDFLIGVMMVGLVGGIFQWISLREQLTRAGWWVPANALGLAVDAAAGLGITFTSAKSILPVPFLETFIGFVTILALAGAIAGSGGGAISSAVLVRLLRLPTPNTETLARPAANRTVPADSSQRK